MPDSNPVTGAYQNTPEHFVARMFIGKILSEDSKRYDGQLFFTIPANYFPEREKPYKNGRRDGRISSSLSSHLMVEYWTQREQRGFVEADYGEVSCVYVSGKTEEGLSIPEDLAKSLRIGSNHRDPVFAFAPGRKFEFGKLPERLFYSVHFDEFVPDDRPLILASDIEREEAASRKRANDLAHAEVEIYKNLEAKLRRKNVLK